MAKKPKHECDECGQPFKSAQALGSHKAWHRRQAKKQAEEKQKPTPPTTPNTDQPPSPPASTPEEIARRLEEIRNMRVQRYAALVLQGYSGLEAVQLAGYDPKNRRNAKSMAKQIEKSLIDKGILLQSLFEAGINQQTLADAMRRAIDSPDEQVSLRAATTLGRWFGFDKGTIIVEGGEGTGLDREERDELIRMAREELARRKAARAPE